MKLLTIILSAFLLCSCANIKGENGRFLLWESGNNIGEGCKGLYGFKGGRLKCSF